MSDPLRIALVGATGLIGSRVMELAIGREDFSLFGIARREVALPKGVRMELFVADTENWSEVIKAQRPNALICALGTTWNKAGKDEAAFRAVDQKLVLDVARAAHEHGVERMVAVGSVGADSMSKNFYLRVKGEVEAELSKIGFPRLDVLRPGLLRGPRGGDRRIMERIGMIASPAMDIMLHGKHRRYRSVDARQVAEATLALAMRKANGRFVHEHDSIMRAARELPKTSAQVE